MKIFLTSLSTFLFLFSINAFADKIIIKGDPVVIQKQGEIYKPTTTLTTLTNDNGYYVTVNNDKRVCYETVQAPLASIDAGVFAVSIGNKVVDLHCYKYSPDFFVIQ